MRRTYFSANFSNFCTDFSANKYICGNNTSIWRTLSIHPDLCRDDRCSSRNIVPDYIEYLTTSGLFNALHEPGHSDNLLSKVEKLYLGNSNIAMALSEDGIVDSGNMRETNFLVWTSQVHKVTASKISDFEIDGITFEVGGKNKKGRQIKDAEVGYLVKDDLEFAAGNSIPIWLFGFIY